MRPRICWMLPCCRPFEMLYTFIKASAFLTLEKRILEMSLCSIACWYKSGIPQITSCTNQ